MKILPSFLAALLIFAFVDSTPGQGEPDPFGGPSPVKVKPHPGCSGDEPDPFSPGATPEKSEEHMVMTNRRLGALIETIDPDLEGQPGFWQFSIEGTELICITDERADRMRLMTPIARIENVGAEQLAECMKANFDRALDARYCVDGGVLYGAFIHPLQDLTPRLFLSAVEQVYTVRATFGTTYTSGGLIFGGDEDEEDGGKSRPDPKQGKKA